MLVVGQVRLELLELQILVVVVAVADKVLPVAAMADLA